jgi:hypothetical protein
MRVAVVVLVLAITSSSARADDWYGEQVLAVDAIGWGAILLGSQGNAIPLALGGATLLLVGPPIVHGFHGSAARAGISLGMRLTGPVIGGLIGNVAWPCGKSCWFPAGILVGGFFGYVTAAVIDMAVVANETDDGMPAARMFSIGSRF